MASRTLRVTLNGTGFAADYSAACYGLIPHKNGVTDRIGRRHFRTVGVRPSLRPRARHHPGLYHACGDVDCGPSRTSTTSVAQSRPWPVRPRGGPGGREVWCWRSSHGLAGPSPRAGRYAAGREDANNHDGLRGCSGRRPAGRQQTSLRGPLRLPRRRQRTSSNLAEPSRARQDPGSTRRRSSGVDAPRPDRPGAFGRRVAVQTRRAIPWGLPVSEAGRGDSSRDGRPIRPRRVSAPGACRCSNISPPWPANISASCRTSMISAGSPSSSTTSPIAEVIGHDLSISGIRNELR